MGDLDRGHAQVVGEADRLVERGLDDAEVAGRDREPPRVVASQERSHAGGRVERQVGRPVRLVAELVEADDVTHVRVGEEDPLEQRRPPDLDVGPTTVAPRPLDLLFQVGGGVEEPAVAAARIDEQQRRHQPPSGPRRVGSRRGAAFVPAADLRQAAVLRRAEHEQVGIARRRPRRLAADAGREEKGEPEEPSRGHRSTTMARNRSWKAACDQLR